MDKEKVVNYDYLENSMNSSGRRTRKSSHKKSSRSIGKLSHMLSSMSHLKEDFGCEVILESKESSESDLEDNHQLKKESYKRGLVKAKAS